MKIWIYVRPKDPLHLKGVTSEYYYCPPPTPTMVWEEEKVVEEGESWTHYNEFVNQHPPSPHADTSSENMLNRLDQAQKIHTHFYIIKQ